MKNTVETIDERPPSAFNKLPDRIKYYLLDWKDTHMEEYLKKYGEVRLNDFDAKQIRGLFSHVTSEDSSLITAIS